MCHHRCRYMSLFSSTEPIGSCNSRSAQETCTAYSEQPMGGGGGCSAMSPCFAQATASDKSLNTSA